MWCFLDFETQVLVTGTNCHHTCWLTGPVLFLQRYMFNVLRTNSCSLSIRKQKKRSVLVQKYYCIKL